MGEPPYAVDRDGPAGGGPGWGEDGPDRSSPQPAMIGTATSTSPATS
ncbi:MAG: hypothetical protein ACR2I1_05565 [Propionibacteriaceae bacterium]